MLKNKYVKWIAVILLILVFGFLSTRKKSLSTKDILIPVEYGDFVSVVYATGQLKAENSVLINLPAEISSRRLNIYEIKVISIIDEGTVVDSGDYVAMLDYSVVEEQRNKAFEEWEKAMEAYDDAKLDTNLNLSNLRDELLNVMVQLEEKKLILSQSIYESPAVKRQAQLDVERSMRNMEQKRRSYVIRKKQSEYQMSRYWIGVTIAKERLDDIDKLMVRLEVKAPKPGMVIYSFDRSGRKIKAGSMVSRWRPKIAELPDLTSMLSKTFINEIDVSKIKAGQHVDIGIDAFPEKHFDGEVLSVANIGQVIPGGSSKVFEVNIKINGSDPDLRPAMTTSNIITIDVLKDVIYIPLDAIFMNDSLQFVYVKDKGENRKQIIDLGVDNENYVVVTEGLRQGEELMLTEPGNSGELNFVGEEIYEKILSRKEEEMIELKKSISEKDNSDIDNHQGSKKEKAGEK